MTLEREREQARARMQRYRARKRQGKRIIKIEVEVDPGETADELVDRKFLKEWSSESATAIAYALSQALKKTSGGA